MANDQKVSEVLADFARTLLTDFPVQGILDHLVTSIVEALPITAAGVTLISRGADPVYVAASDSDALEFEKLQSQLAEGPCMHAFNTGHAISVPDLASDTRYPIFGPRALELGLRAVFTFPLRQRDHQLGALDLYRDSPGELDAPTMDAAQTLADVASAYILNARTRSELQLSSDRHLANSLHDTLTGLPNRILLRERLDHAVRSASRSHKTVAVLFADLDRFKSVNDTYGHQVGDELLIAVGERLEALLRPGDTLSRVSGDEFVILCEDLDEPSQANLIADRLGSALAEPYVLSDAVVHLTASIGIAVAEWTDKPDQILHVADLAMYQAKRKGGATTQVIDLLEQELVDENTTLEHDLYGAATRKELRADYQPIIRAHDGKITGVEALLRWDHPERGLVGPNVLIPVAERSGLIDDVGRWILLKACWDRHRWAADLGDEDFAVAVNVSVHQLFSREFNATVSDALSETDTDPRLLTLEVTESIFLEDSERALNLLDRLKRLGVVLALDDFGTGYSSLSYLKQFPFDIVKIDRQFVVDVDTDVASQAIVSAIITLASALDMEVIAEGVETKDQLVTLTGLNCDALQGFYLARPMSATAVLDLLHASRGTMQLDTLAAKGMRRRPDLVTGNAAGTASAIPKLLA